MMTMRSNGPSWSRFGLDSLTAGRVPTPADELRRKANAFRSTLAEPYDERRPATDVEHDDQGCTTCNPHLEATPEDDE